ncbi:MAG: flagellar protein FlgN [Lachnospiraceae bacterium]|nr:flagellar protein FlgN [Lachnospiraceae bacterium]
MASLMENLIDILNEQYDAYSALVELSKKKTPIIVSGSLEELQKITDDEQLAVDKVNNIDKKRLEIMGDIANVLNREEKDLKISDLISLINTRPEEQTKLEEAREKLIIVGKELKIVNERNKELLENALEMIDFDLNLIQAMKQAPQMGNYNQSGINTGEVYGTNLKGFDTKQ